MFANHWQGFAEEVKPKGLHNADKAKYEVLEP